MTILEDLKKLLECPCCYDIPFPGTNSTGLCENGHIVCTRCAQQVLRQSASCPMCRDLKFYIVRGHCLTIKVINILTNHMIYTCKHANCLQAMTGNLLLQHQRLCQFKPLICPAANCGFISPISDFLSGEHPECLDIVQRDHVLEGWHLTINIDQAYCFDTNIARVNESYKPSLLVGRWNDGQFDSHAYINMANKHGNVIVFPGWLNKYHHMDDSLKNLKINMSVFIYSISGVIGQFVAKRPLYQGNQVTQINDGVCLHRQTLFNWSEWSSSVICPECPGNVQTPHFHVKVAIVRQ
jgi:hypothetical protein